MNKLTKLVIICVLLFASGANVYSQNPVIQSPRSIITTQAATVPLSIQGAASQSANLTEWKDSTGAVLASVSAAGVFSGAAPTNATYITQTANATLTAEQALSALATGIMAVTTGTGVVSNATATAPVTITGTAIGCATCGVTGSPLSQFAATTSAQLAGVISDETGSGALAFATSPALVTPNIGVATATSIAIGANTLDTTEWANLDGLNQTVATTSTPQHARLGLGAAADGTALLNVNGDTDASAFIGRARFGSPVSDRFYLSHYDHSASGNYAIMQTATGDTNINAPTGQQILFNINASSKWIIDANTIFPAADNSYDIGTGSVRSRTGYFGTRVNIGSGLSSATGFLFIQDTASNPIAYLTTSITPTAGTIGGELRLSHQAFPEDLAKYAATGSILGQLGFGGQANDTSYTGGYIKSVVTTGGNVGRSSHVADMTFWTKPSGNTGPTEKVKITGAGHLQPSTDAASNLGSGTLRWLEIFASAALSVGTNPAQSGAVRLANAASILQRNAANSADLQLTQIDSSNNVFFSGSDQLSIYQGAELSADPAAPAANGFRLYAKDNGSSKTTLCARFATGAVQCFATEP